MDYYVLKAFALGKILVYPPILIPRVDLINWVVLREKKINFKKKCFFEIFYNLNWWANP